MWLRITSFLSCFYSFRLTFTDSDDVRVYKQNYARKGNAPVRHLNEGSAPMTGVPRVGFNCLVQRALEAMLRGECAHVAQGSIPAPFIADLLAVDSSAGLGALQLQETCDLGMAAGYPDQPYYRHLADALLRLADPPRLWELPAIEMIGVVEQDAFGGIDIQRVSNFVQLFFGSYQESTVCSVTWCSSLQCCKRVLMCHSHHRAKIVLHTEGTTSMTVELSTLHACIDVLSELGVRGILRMLGMRRTESSVDACPPPRAALVRAFERRHRPQSKSILTVGARCLLLV